MAMNGKYMPENWILVTLNINREVCTFVYVLQQCGYGTSTTYLYELNALFAAITVTGDRTHLFGDPTTMEDFAAP